MIIFSRKNQWLLGKPTILGNPPIWNPSILTGDPGYFGWPKWTEVLGSKVIGSVGWYIPRKKYPIYIPTTLVGGDVWKCNLHFSCCVLSPLAVSHSSAPPQNRKPPGSGLTFYHPPPPKKNVTWHAPGALFCGIRSTWQTSTMTMYINKKWRLHVRTSLLISGS